MNMMQQFKIANQRTAIPLLLGEKVGMRASYTLTLLSDAFVSWPFHIRVHRFALRSLGEGGCLSVVKSLIFPSAFPSRLRVWDNVPLVVSYLCFICIHLWLKPQTWTLKPAPELANFPFYVEQPQAISVSPD
jgi:hypothetical protein